MANHDVRTYHWPPVIPDQRFNRNGMLPNAALLRRLADTFNWVAHRQKKHIASYTQALNDLRGSTGASVWPTYFRTGEGTKKLQLSLGLQASSSATPGEVELILTDITGAGAASFSETYRSTVDGSVGVPSSFTHVTRTITAAPNNEFSSYFNYSGAIPIYFSLAEAPVALADDSLTGICNPAAFVAEGPIYDAHIADLIDANNKLWRHNGSHLISFIGFHNFLTGGTTAFTNSTSTTTYNNVQDSSASVTDTSPGWKLYTTYHATANRTTIPVKMAVQVDRTAGTGTCDIKFTDGTNSVSITGIGDTGDAWSTTTGTIPVQDGTKWDLHWKVSSGTTTFRIRGASLFTYEV
jgi:hypothetical protein